MTGIVTLMRNLKQNLGPLIILAAFPAMGSANDAVPQRWFQADLVVFVNNTSMNGPELWPTITPHPIPPNAISLKSPSASSAAPSLSDLIGLNGNTQKKALPDLERDAFIALPRESQVLMKQGNALSATGDYKIISQMAWIMPLEDDSVSKPIKVHAYNSAGEPSLLEGSVSISSSRFLHADVNLWYSELSREALSNELIINDPDTTPDSTPTEQQKPVVRRDLQLVMDPSGTPMKITRNFQLQESRRIRNTDQVQYLDSPVLGVLIKLTPYDRPDEPLLPEIQTDQQAEPVLGLLPGTGLNEDNS